MERQLGTSYLRTVLADSLVNDGDRPLSGQWGRYFGTLDTSVGTSRNSWPVYGSGISTGAGLSTQAGRNVMPSWLSWKEEVRGQASETTPASRSLASA